ncbi:TRAP transporter substrate-binding protein DctP [Oceanimonas sp. NS1]|nr:TRAP transporter substrate-binding protein DctP [Oceanimonas sp. NS1]
MALKTGVADGQMNPPMYIILGSLQEVQQHLTLANIQYSDQFLVANGELLESLTDEQRQALKDAVAEANQLNRESVEAKVEERVQFLADKGMQVYRPTAEELAQFQEKAKPSYINWLKEQNIEQKWVDLALEDAGKF